MKLVHNNHRINYVRTVKEGAKFVMSHTTRYVCIGENANGIFHVFLFQPKSAMFIKPSDWCGIIPCVVSTARIDWFFGAPAQYTKHEYSTKPLYISDSFMPVERHIVYCWLNPPYTCNRHNKVNLNPIRHYFISFPKLFMLTRIAEYPEEANTNEHMTLMPNKDMHERRAVLRGKRICIHGENGVKPLNYERLRWPVRINFDSLLHFYGIYLWFIK